jgi:serine/threonine protein phosphatase PrpC
VEHGVYVLCDGMGGAAAGEVASSTAIEEVMRRLTQREPGVPLPAVAEAAVGAANRTVYELSRHQRRFRGMGTTLVALVVDEHYGWVLNIGDSRCYLMRNRQLQQVTRDHSLIDEEVRRGRMSPAEARYSPYRNVITRALGTQSTVDVDVFEMETEPGDLFLLCSDGLTRDIDDSLIESILGLDLPLAELCARLVNAANQAGGGDNITCLLARAA